MTEVAGLARDAVAITQRVLPAVRDVLDVADPPDLTERLHRSARGTVCRECGHWWPCPIERLRRALDQFETSSIRWPGREG